MEDKVFVKSDNPNMYPAFEFKKGDIVAICRSVIKGKLKLGLGRYIYYDIYGCLNTDGGTIFGIITYLDKHKHHLNGVIYNWKYYIRHPIQMIKRLFARRMCKIEIL